MEMEFAINISTKTWTRDSHGLFDYESQQIKNHEGTLSNNAIIVRKKMEIKLIKSCEEIKEEEFLCEIKIDENCKKIKNDIKNLISSYLFQQHNRKIFKIYFFSLKI